MIVLGGHMGTFDGSTNTAPDAPPREVAPQDQPPQKWSTPAPPEPEFDALASLQEQMRARDEIDTEIRVEIPGLGWRMVCDTDLPYPVFAKWQKASFPRSQRNGRKVNPLDMDRAVLATFVLLGTCVGMEYQEKGSGEWLPVLDVDDRPMTPNSKRMMDRFDQVDEKVFLRKLFGTDSALTRAGTKVMEAAGWNDEESDDDPTGQG
jgi:hypothetical protein